MERRFIISYRHNQVDLVFRFSHDFLILFAGVKMCIRCDPDRYLLGAGGDADSCDLTYSHISVSAHGYHAFS